MNVLALDLSLTSTGYAWQDDGQLVHGTIKPKHTGMERLAYLDEQIAEEVTASRAELVAIEGYSFGSKGRAVFNIGELGGVVRLGLYHAGVEFVEVAPSTIKKYATGKGNAPKEMVRDCARDRFSLDAGVPSDVCDAIWLLAVVREALGEPMVTVPKVNRTAVDVVRAALGVPDAA